MQLAAHFMIVNSSQPRLLVEESTILKSVTMLTLNSYILLQFSNIEVHELILLRSIPELMYFFTVGVLEQTVGPSHNQ